MAVTENVNIFQSVCNHVSCYDVNCVFYCRAYIRFDICNAYISYLELFKLYAKFSLADNLACFTSHLMVGALWMNLTGFFGLSYHAVAHKMFKPES